MFPGYRAAKATEKRRSTSSAGSPALKIIQCYVSFWNVFLERYIIKHIGAVRGESYHKETFCAALLEIQGDPDRDENIRGRKSDWDEMNGNRRKALESPSV